MRGPSMNTDQDNIPYLRFLFRQTFRSFFPSSLQSSTEFRQIMANTTKIQCTCAQKGSDTITASSKEPQCSLPQEGSFEVVEHSDAVGHQCEEASTPLTEMKRKVHELEKKLEVKNEKEKVDQDFCVKLAFLTLY